ncbi:MAG: hypothetical protein D6732_27255 [Methanobacteriota archaeon]|nr:MAG: hypothetical protein D6732_27255 [Euryarchaeota archaeon]
MSFFKKIFGKGKSPEQKAEEFLLNYRFERPVQITSLEESPVEPEVLLKVMKELVHSKRIAGRFVGKKGWFIPGDPTPIFNEILEEVRKNPVSIEKISEKLQLSKKRSIIALKDELKRKQKLNDYHFTETHVFYLPYLRRLWESRLSSYDLLEEEHTLEDILADMEYREVLEELVGDWLVQEKSPVVRFKSGRLMHRDEVPELLIEHVKKRWEEGAESIHFEDLAEEFGLPEDQVTQLILDLVNKQELHDVTVFTTDRMIKRRSSF